MEESVKATLLVLVRQVLLGLMVSSGAISTGLTLGFSAVAMLPMEKPPDSLNTDEIKWFASISSIATPLGCLICGPLLDKFGRKVSLLALTPPFFLGWVLMATTSKPTPIAQLYVGRILTGIATGMASVPGAVYLGEVSRKNIRGMLITWPSVAISLGILVVYGLGAGFPDDWRVVAWICGALPVVTALLTLFFVPESPVWLLQKGRTEEALEVRKKLGLEDEVPLEEVGHVNGGFSRDSIQLDKPEMATISPTLPPLAPMPEDTPNPREDVLTRLYRKLIVTLEPLLLPEAWKPLLILNGYFFFQQFSGIYVVVSYASDIVVKAGVSLDTHAATVLVGSAQLVAGIAVSFALNKWGRRPLSIWSGVGMSVCMLAMGLYLQLVPHPEEASRSLAVIPLIALIAYVVAGAMGFHTIPWALLGELYPTRARGVAAGLTTCLAYLFNFGSLQLYPLLLKNLSPQGVFYMYGAVSVVATVYVALLLPETLGKTLEQIERGFASGKRRWMNAAETPASISPS